MKAFFHSAIFISNFFSKKIYEKFDIDTKLKILVQDIPITKIKQLPKLTKAFLNHENILLFLKKYFIRAQLAYDIILVTEAFKVVICGPALKIIS